jgi:drug/metabolite transporter (DMT)-like permease
MAANTAGDGTIRLPHARDMPTHAHVSPNPEHNHRRSVWMMLVAVLMFALMDAGLKTLSAHYPPLQVATLRGLSSLPLVLAWVLLTIGLRPLLRIRWSLHLLRGVLGIVMMGSFIYGLKRLPLSTAYSIFFVAPLLITALSVPILGEKVGPRRWTAIAVGLLGVLTVLRPTGAGVFTWAGLAVLVASLGYAVSAITVRVLARTDSNQAMVFWMLAMMALGAGMLAWPSWVPVRMQDAWIIGVVGIAGSLGQYTITEAFRRGEASLIAPLEYTALVWGVTLDLALWGVLPDGMTWLGAAIIIASGLYLLRRERVHAEAEHP